MPPPYILRSRWQDLISALVPATHEPTGAPSPLERHTLTESNPAASSRSVLPHVTAAFHRRAPSRWAFMPSSCVIRTTSASSAGSHTLPPASFCVFSTATILLGEPYGSYG